MEQLMVSRWGLRAVGFYQQVDNGKHCGEGSSVLMDLCQHFVVVWIHLGEALGQLGRPRQGVF